MKILPVKEQKNINGCHIFKDVNDNLLKVYFAHGEMVSFMTKPQKPGIDLIQFCETDLSDLKNLTEDIQKSNFFKNKDSMDADYTDILFMISNVLDKYLEKNYSVHLFLANEYNKIDKIYEDDTFQSLCEIINDFIQSIEFILAVQAFFVCSLHICFASDNTYHKRISCFFALNPDLTDYQFTTAFTFSPTIDGKLDSEKILEIINEQSYASDMSSDKVNIAEYVIAGNIFDMYLYELLEVIKQGINLGKCWYCGNFFIPKTKKKTLFCDRVNENGRSCKQKGSKIKFNAEKENDMYLKEYQKIYNRYYARAERFTYADISSPKKVMVFSIMDFQEWSLSASDVRKKYLSGEISGEEMIKKIEVFG